MAESARILIWWVLLWFAPVLLVATIFYLVLSRPLKRNEQARMFLKLLEHASQGKRSVESWMIDVAATEDRSMGIGFHLVAAYLEAGEKLDAALKRVNWFLPPAVRGVLLAGMEGGNLQAAIKSAQTLLAAGVSKAQSAFHYVIVLMIFLLPPFALSPLFLKVFVHPKLQAIAADVYEGMPSSTIELLGIFEWVFVFQILFLTGAIFIISLYLGIHRRFALLDRLFGPLGDWMTMMIPWQRKRAIRSFSMILSLLLDADVPETRALELAGEYSGNRLLRSAALRMAERVRNGTSLEEAAEELTHRSDFKWRFAMAARTREGFTAALCGWHDALESEAYRREQGAAHLFSSAIIIAMGVMVCLVVSSVFLLLNHILSEALTW